MARRLARGSVWMLVLGLPLGCTVPNPEYDGVDPSNGAGVDTSTGPSPSDETSDAASTGITPSPDGTAGGIDGTDGTDETGIEPEPTDTGGELGDHRIILFQGPPIPGNGPGQVGEQVFNYASNRCLDHYNAFYGDFECETGRVWGLLGSGTNRLWDYPRYPGGQSLADGSVFAADEITLIAESYDDLVTGELVVPLVGNAVEGPDDAIYWWGESSMGDPSSNCHNWTMGNGTTLGATIMADDINPFFSYEGLPCDQALPLLCICF